MNDTFIKRQIGPRDEDIKEMLEVIGVESLDQLIEQTIPESIRLKTALDLPEGGISEYEFFRKIKELASQNKPYHSLIGMGYYGTRTPSVILRNVFENPGWYTSYTPYQAEISQGRLEALLNFQTVITELTGMEISNCSLLDEATAAAEGMSLMFDQRKRKDVKAGKNKLFIDENIFPHTLDVIRLRAEPIGVQLVVGDFREFEPDELFFGAIIQNPAADGTIRDYKAFAEKLHAKNILLTVVVDIMAQVMLTKPADMHADVVVGNTQRFGIPVGFGGPHAAFLATSEKYKRYIPGRIIGVSIDKHNKPALRMALQTREQHIKRERATSNICTAQALLASMAGFYAIYHGPEGLKSIAKSIHLRTVQMEIALKKLGYEIHNQTYYDTLKIGLPEGIKSCNIQAIALDKEINLNYIDDKTIGLSMDEAITESLMEVLIGIFSQANNKTPESIAADPQIRIPDVMLRNDNFLKQEVFNSYHSETEMMRYIKKLEKRDIALNHSMIPLGSCTMKLNPAVTMLPLSWPEFNSIHPFAPADQWKGYRQLICELERDLAKITGYAAISLQPNSGAAGEHTGLMVIRAYHKDHNEEHRNICLVPSSAHGTNPASSIMAGMKVVVVDCDEKGNINIEDLKEKAEAHKDDLSAFMVTYPSTHGVFESRIKEMIQIIHDNGGLVYMDGANMNAQLGLTHPGTIGADVCHLNLHKTFAIPHGGGGPGVGPIGVAEHLKDYLPGHSIVKTGGDKAILAGAEAPFGSPSILPITYGFIKMLGSKGLEKVAKLSILNANYLAASLKQHYEVLYTGETGRCAHEFILNCQSFQSRYHVGAADIAHRLMDYGFHAPTLSFPVHETLMVEPTESESKEELDRFIDSMISIRKELDAIKSGEQTAEDNVISESPHTAEECCSDKWEHAYSRQEAAYPLKWISENKFWPSVGKIDNGYGDRHLMCTCDPIESYKED